MNYTQHGYVNTAAYKAWTNAKSRCYNKNNKDYPNYGGRGIKIYEDWVSSPKVFCDWIIENLGERTDGGTLDRIDSNRDYEPGNLRWADRLEQARNRRNSNSDMCKRGHPFNEENTYIIPSRGQRSCRKCNLIASHKYHRKLRSQE